MVGKGTSLARRLGLAAVLGVSLLGGTARAAEPVITPDRLRAAEEEYDAGRRAYLAEQWEAAALHFENAFRDAPRSQVLRNAMRSRQKARQLARAATLADLAKRRYAADTQTLALADEVLADAQPKLYEAKISCTEDCAVTADGKLATLEDTKGFSLFLDPGPHALSFAFSKGRHIERNVDARAGAREELPIEAPALPKVDTPEKPVEPKPGPVTVAPSSGLPPAFFFVGLGLTVAAGAATVISGVATLSSPGKDAVREGCVGQGEACELYKSGLSGEVRTNVGLGITAGAAVGTAIVGLFLTDWGPSGPKRSALRAPSVGVGWQSVRLSGTF